MALQLVSQSAQEDRGAREPDNAPIFDLTPPVDLSDSKIFTQGQPFEAFRTMREQAPVMWHSLNETNLEGFWALTRYDDVRAASLDTKTFSSQKGGIMMAYPSDERRHPQLHSASLDTMICLDAPHHMQLRREHMAYFKLDYIRQLKVKVEAKVTSLLDNLAKELESGPVDFVEHFSSQMPLFTLCEMLGVPEADRPKIRNWMDQLELAGYILADADLATIDPMAVMTFLQQVQEMFAYGREILLDRRKNPTQDLLSAIANVEIDGARLPDEYLDGSWLLIIIAGNDTTRNSTSGAMKLLTQFADAKADCIANADLIPNMVHEVVRMVSPVMYMRRTATQATEIRGQAIAEGEKVILYYGAANRDPEIFENPDVFDIHRANAKDHIGFGIGPHVCLGQRVANMQLEAAYRQILARFPTLRWTGEEEILPNSFTHSIGKLMVELG